MTKIDIFLPGKKGEYLKHFLKKNQHNFIIPIIAQFVDLVKIQVSGIEISDFVGSEIKYTITHYYSDHNTIDEILVSLTEDSSNGTRIQIHVPYYWIPYDYGHNTNLLTNFKSNFQDCTSLSSLSKSKSTKFHNCLSEESELFSNTFCLDCGSILSSDETNTSNMYCHECKKSFDNKVQKKFTHKQQYDSDV